MVAVPSCIALGFDSFLACVAIAPLLAERRLRIALPLLFGACDRLASLVAGRGPAPILLGAYLVLLLVVGCGLGGTWRLSVIPVAVSIDNLLVPLAPKDAVVAGLASFALAAAGIAVATLLLGSVPAGARRYVAATLSACAVLAFLIID
jgi:hypothetical protein